MKRDIEKFKDQFFDLLIVGGGIHGAAMAKVLSERGFKSALVEKEDFCQKTSFNSLKILHGGLRYLQHADFKRMRESIRARHEFMKTAPHLVSPLPCIMPTKGYGIKGKYAMGAALLLNDLISFDRNRDLEQENHLPRGEICSKEETLAIIPDLNDPSLNGSALWYDALLLNSERMVFHLLDKACQHGATIANYLGVQSFSEKETHQETVVHDFLSGSTFTIKSRVVINCAGPWIDHLTDSQTEASSRNKLAKAVNLIVNRRLFGKYAVGLESQEQFADKDNLIRRDKRLFFFVPWRQKTMIGTTYKHSFLDDAQLYTDRQDIEEIIHEVNQIYPPAKLRSSDVVFSHVGLVPVYDSSEDDSSNTPKLIKHSEIIDHLNENKGTGRISIKGVKYTTAPEVACSVARLLEKKRITPFKSDKNSRIGNNNRFSKNNSSLKTDPLFKSRYGLQAGIVQTIFNEDAENQKSILSDPQLFVAEVLFAIREEMAFHLTDIVFRRTEVGTCGFPGKDALYGIGLIMEKELKWKENRLSQEVEQVIEIYKRMNIEIQ